MAILNHREPRPHARFGSLFTLALALAIAWCETAFAANAQTQLLELRLEAAFLYNFAKFVEWPSDSGTPGSAPLTFCVLGAEPLYGALAESLAGRNINGRPLVARQIASPQEGLRCQLAFIGWAEKKRQGEALDALAGSSALTVSDCEQFARHGGMIQLVKDGNKFRFVINVDAVNHHGLHVSSKLLQLAEVVHESLGSKP